MKRSASTSVDLTTEVNGKRSRSTSVTPGTIDGFPRWSKGTVGIRLSDDPKHYYQFHKAVLERNSTWFFKDDAVTIPQMSSAGPVRFYFVLQKQKDSGLPPMLMQQSFSPLSEKECSQTRSSTVLTTPESIKEVHAISSQKMDPGSGLDTLPKEAPFIKKVTKAEIKLESSTVEETINALQEDADARKAEEVHALYLEAYNNMFLAYYNQMPKFCSTNIDTAIEQCEYLIILAEIYGSLQVVRPYIGNTLSQHRRNLFLAIAQDPPRWLNISVPIQSSAIFAEALIHIVGCWPRWSWKTSMKTLWPDIREIISSKAKKLTDLRAEVDREIFLNTIKIGNRPVSIASEDTKYFETWMVVQVFRDWVCRQMTAYREAKKPHFGTIYRIMHKGGDAYLPYEEQHALFMKCARSNINKWDEASDDLKLVKNYAKDIVAVLVKNHSMLDVEEFGIEYLTCTEVGVDDYPWMRGKDYGKL